MTNNSIKNEGAMVIMNLLHHHENLQRVDLTKNMVNIRYLSEIKKIMEKKREYGELSKLQNVRQEIIDLKVELTTMPSIQKETKKVILEKENLLKQFYDKKLEKNKIIKEENRESKIIEGKHSLPIH